MGFFPKCSTWNFSFASRQAIFLIAYRLSRKPKLQYWYSNLFHEHQEKNVILSWLDQQPFLQMICLAGIVPRGTFWIIRMIRRMHTWSKHGNHREQHWGGEILIFISRWMQEEEIQVWTSWNHKWRDKWRCHLLVMFHVEHSRLSWSFAKCKHEVVMVWNREQRCGEAIHIFISILMRAERGQSWKSWNFKWRDRWRFHRLVMFHVEHGWIVESARFDDSWKVTLWDQWTCKETEQHRSYVIGTPSDLCTPRIAIKYVPPDMKFLAVFHVEHWRNVFE